MRKPRFTPLWAFVNGNLSELLRTEWSMGNGQCPECYGCPESWFGHPLHKTSDTIGHETDCAMAKAIIQLGGKPLMLGEFSP